MFCKACAECAYFHCTPGSVSACWDTMSFEELVLCQPSKIKLRKDHPCHSLLRSRETINAECKLSGVAKRVVSKRVVWADVPPG